MSNGSHYTRNDIIAAPATPNGRGAIAVIRVSGAGSSAIVSRLFDRPMPPHSTVRYGKIIVPDTTPPQTVDTAVVTYYQAPHSYTGEDCVELSLHGSPVILATVMKLLNRLGVRSAEPGEFTLRAYLNGKLDLTQAEAVADLINADSKQSAEYALRQLNGSLGSAINLIYDHLLSILTLYTIELDFSDEDIKFATDESKHIAIRTAITELEQMCEGYQHSRFLREGVKVAITGAPNVGKSSLFNSLLKENRSIVHQQAGTTRDVLSATCIINGIRFELFDSAGVRTTGDEIEAEGVRRALETIRTADIILYVASSDISDSYDLPTGISGKVIRVNNKCDLVAPLSIPVDISVSTKSGYGLEQLTDLLSRFVTHGGTIPALINRERHYIAIQHALQALIRTEEVARNGFPSEIIAEELQQALEALGSITGRGGVEQLLDNVFTNFCVGK